MVLFDPNIILINRIFKEDIEDETEHYTGEKSIKHKKQHLNDDMCFLNCFCNNHEF